MYKISNIKISVRVKKQNQELIKKIKEKVNIKKFEIKSLNITRRSIDARNKDKVFYVYSAEFSGNMEIKHLGQKNGIDIAKKKEYPTVLPGEESFTGRPVVCGFGPSGILAAFMLAEAGYSPIVMERGKAIEDREADVKDFWKTGVLNTESNVQYGEGGAGTFSDGKLTTQIKNPRCKKVLELFVQNGAPDEILYDSMPHIGTDLLKKVITNIRKKIIAFGGEILFETKVEEILVEDGKVRGVVANGKKYETDLLLLGIGNSSRDMFEYLNELGASISAKPFAVGMRIEHLQEEINQAQYGKFAPHLGAADYKLVYHGKEDRTAYTFCMCPGGLVINASSEEGHLVTNGMSFHARNAVNSNSAVLVNVMPEDFPGESPLAGIKFQRELEKIAFDIGGKNNKAPVQLLGDFMEGRTSTKIGRVNPSFSPGFKFVDFNEHLPEYISGTMKEAFVQFGKKIKGFDSKDAVLTGFETRSSSPVRINRNDRGMSENIEGLYPIGEGAGYAGGIISAAVDGMVGAENIIQKYKPIRE